MSIKRKIAWECATEEFAETQISNKDDGIHLGETRLELDSNLESEKLINCNVLCLRKAWGGDESTQHVLSRSISILSQGERESTRKKNTLQLPVPEDLGGSYIKIKMNIL